MCVDMYASALSGESMHLYLHVCMCFVGEVAAVCVSGVINLSDAVGTVALRNRVSGCVCVPGGVVVNVCQFAIYVFVRL